MNGNVKCNSSLVLSVYIGQEFLVKEETVLHYLLPCVTGIKNVWVAKFWWLRFLIAKANWFPTWILSDRVVTLHFFSLQCYPGNYLLWWKMPLEQYFQKRFMQSIRASRCSRRWKKIHRKITLCNNKNYIPSQTLTMHICLLKVSEKSLRKETRLIW